MSNKPKLAVLSAFYEPYMSGAERMVKEIVEQMGSKYDITLITGRYDRANAKVEERASYKLIRVGIGHKQLDKLLYVMLAPFKVRQIKPSITHAVMESYAGAALVFVKYAYSKTKRILTLQSGDLDDPRKQRRPQIGFFWKIIHRSPDLITAISTVLAKRATGLGVHPEKISITPNGIDLAEVPSGLSKIPNRVLSMGRLSWEKGFEYLIGAWPGVIKEAPSARLAIYGEGKKRQELLKQISELGVSESVEIRPLIPHREFMKEMARAAIFVLPSLAEGLGNVFIEAQACATPPIGTCIGGIPDIIQNERNGLLVNPKNSEEIKAAVIRLLKDKDLAGRLAEKGLETSRQFEWSQTITKFDKIYSTLLKHN